MRAIVQKEKIKIKIVSNEKGSFTQPLPAVSLEKITLCLLAEYKIITS
jgi:hypothetical protein